ncbi:unnamed protein product [Rhizoctonia solani]|uniref:Uncharacterized protein n=1 Tax=Rhizoctonia solani TaxID=456999 RepID=A0A8H2XNR9_9AGAM|nr:unnamed protein product [Rhizoctonia solani]
MPRGISGMNPQIAALNFFGESPMPALERFEVEYDGIHHLNIEERWGKIISNKPLFHDSLPTRLKVARLEWVPNPYLFAGSLAEHPQLIGLTHLEIKFPPKLPKLEHINALLAASPMLKVLYFDTRIRRCDHVHPEHQPQLSAGLPKVGLPNVRALGLLFNTSEVSPWWGYSLLLMLDAPNVQSLRLLLERPGCRARAPVDEGFIQHLTKGADKAKPKPLFPLLTSLELTEPRLGPSSRKSLAQELLEAYPNITTLILPLSTQAHLLGIQPWLVPCLKRLVIHAKLASDLRESISERCMAALGLKTVEVLVFGSDKEKVQSEYREALDGLGVDVCFSDLSYRSREILGFEDF